MPKTRFDWVVVTIVVALLGTAWISFSRVSPADANPNGRPPAPQTGHPAPDFTLTTLDGEEITLRELRGNPVVINFWGTWCGPCRAEMPAIEAVYNQYRDEGLVVLAINDAEPPNLVNAFVTDLGLTFPIVMDPQREVQFLYMVRAFPSTYFVDREGVIQRAVYGSMTQPVIDGHVREIIER